jgi:hypothetical protein
LGLTILSGLSPFLALLLFVAICLVIAGATVLDACRKRFSGLQVLKTVGVTAIVVAAIGTANAVFFRDESTCPSGVRFRLIKPYPSNGGLSYTASLPPSLRNVSDTATTPNRSTIVVCEDGMALGPPHSLHKDIAAEGKGRFSHWNESVVFSSSEGSDPNRNQKLYLIVFPSGQP